MLEPTLHALSKSRIILASGSPQRRELIQFLGINVEVIPSTFDENLDRKNYENHGKFVEDLAYHKVLDVYERLKNDPIPPGLIIGADTLVTLNDTIFGKPENDEDALRILTRLSGKKNTVFTGVCLKTPETEVKFYQSTDVYMGDLSEEQIKAYIKTGEHRGKAGAFGAIGKGSYLIEKINGDFYTVVGLPLFSIVKNLNELFS